MIAITSELKMKNRARTLDVPTNSEAKLVEVASELFNSFFAENEGISVRSAGIRVSRSDQGIRICNEKSDVD